MKKSFGVLLSAASSVIALAVTTAPAKANQSCYINFQQCPNFYGPYSCYDNVTGAWVQGLDYACGLFGGNSVIGYLDSTINWWGWWGYQIMGWCADGSDPWSGPNYTNSPAGTVTVSCPPGVALMMGSMQIRTGAP